MLWARHLHYNEISAQVFKAVAATSAVLEVNVGHDGLPHSVSRAQYQKAEPIPLLPFSPKPSQVSIYTYEAKKLGVKCLSSRQMGI